MTTSSPFAAVPLAATAVIAAVTVTSLYLLIKILVDDGLVFYIFGAAGELDRRQSLDHALQGWADHRHHGCFAVASKATLNTVARGHIWRR